MTPDDEFEESMRRARLRQDAYDADIEALCERIGYGNVMASASRLWAAKCDAKGEPRGNFAVGACEVMTVPCPHPASGKDVRGHCDWCCGAGWVTKKVLEAINDAG